MNNSFILVHAEAVNMLRNAVCHIVLIPVDNGAIQPIEEFFVNPESDFFEWVQSGITREEVAGFRPLKDEWAAIQSVLERYPVIVSSGDGYSIDALSGTLRRLHVPFEAFQYCNAKEILRSSTSQLSYSLDYLTFFLLQDDAAEASNPVQIAVNWARCIIAALKDAEDESLTSFLGHTRVVMGLSSPEEFIPAFMKKKPRPHKGELDLSGIEIEPHPENPFFECNVVFTGKMQMPRDEARKAVIRIGGFAPKGLTQDTDYLVVGVQDLRVVGESGLSSKMKTAQKYREKGLPIEVISEADFLEMIQY